VHAEPGRQAINPEIILWHPNAHEKLVCSLIAIGKNKRLSKQLALLNEAFPLSAGSTLFCGFSQALQPSEAHVC
jgi:hypothetical protein